MFKNFVFVIFLHLLTGCFSTVDPTTTIPADPGLAAVTSTFQVSPISVAPQIVLPTPTSNAAPSVSSFPTQTLESVASLNPSAASTLPDPSTVYWEQVFQGLESPVGITNAADGSGRLYILEQPGTIRVAENDSVLPRYFLDIRDRVGSSGSEQGLLGLAFHPNFPQDDRLFVYYTDSSGDTVISSFSLSKDDPSIADARSEEVLITVDQPYPNHNGGQLAFGPDGYLYIGTGDGGSAGDPHGNGQSIGTLLGKILRIDINTPGAYTIPPDNPFSEGEGLPEIWAYGLRNPWRFSFDRLTGDMYIGDVGQNLWEEIDFLPAENPGGANFGWNYFEGSHSYLPAPATEISMISPLFEYEHEYGCSVTGGYVYRGSLLEDFYGVYLFGDYCSGNVWGLIKTPDGQVLSNLLFTNVGRITSFGEDESGEIYLVDHAGFIYTLKDK